ncbi:hypothetical protein SPAN111604_08900 [Sphingomonas antarctica]|uniref:hypothetical protein n=1 Tax=Sphingomonas antarctica TaxID=2040274 RepID=UPI0039ECB9AB
MEAYVEPGYAPEAPTRDWRSPALLGILALAGAAWLAFVALMVLPELRASLPPASGAAALTVIALVPLLFFAGLYALFARGSRAEARRLRLMIQALRGEQANMQASIDAATDRIIIQRAQIEEGGAALGATGERAATDMRAMSETLRGDLDLLSRHANALKQATAVARADMALLLGDVPKAHIQTREMAAEIDLAARSALGHAEALTAQVGALATQSHDAKVLAETSAAALSDGNARAAEQAVQAREAIAGATAALTEGVDAALDRAHQATEGVRLGLAAQGAALEAFVGSAEQAIARSGEQAGVAAQARIAELEDRVAALGALLESQSEATRGVLTDLAGALGDVDARLGSFTGHDEVLGRAEARLRALDAGARDLGEALPMLLDGASQRLHAAGETANEITPQIRALAGDAERAAGHLAGLSDSGRSAAELGETLAAALATAEALSQQAGGQLVDALLRVREVAASSADKAREAITNAIPDAVARLSDEARRALADAVAHEVEASVGAVAAAIERAVAVSQSASAGINQQLLALDERVAAADVRRDLSAQVALLVESLNSTAIDVAKLLSTEIADTAWDAYLRGDRGVFTRRAVRLLSGGEARTVATYYGEDPDFRDGVNRYVHDFEAMLRQVLSTREGHALGVTLLSSDMGKLYVALAQAIERLRA